MEPCWREPFNQIWAISLKADRTVVVPLKVYLVRFLSLTALVLSNLIFHSRFLCHQERVMGQRGYEGVGQDMSISFQMFLEDVNKRKYMYYSWDFLTF